jgi:hypothetical protein
MQCPKCGDSLSNKATYCGCGWKKGNAQDTKLAYPNDPPRVPCCQDGCFLSSTVKIKTPLGWANFCDQHYAGYFRDQGIATCQRMGLDTPAKQRRWVTDWMLANKMPIREPGQDDEEIPF